MQNKPFAVNLQMLKPLYDGQLHLIAAFTTVSSVCEVVWYLRVIRQQDESLHHVHGVSGHGEHFGHEVAVTLEESDGAQLNVKQQS